MLAKTPCGQAIWGVKRRNGCKGWCGVGVNFLAFEYTVLATICGVSENAIPVFKKSVRVCACDTFTPPWKRLVLLTFG